MSKLICIVGPTGTGKTKKAIELAREKPSILVSADSRQVYRGMDIVTGKDHPKDTVIFGIDIVDPDQSISVAVWHDSVMPHIHQAWDEGKQVIVVGGTGLYVKSIVEGIETMHVGVNQTLRNGLAKLTTAQLQEKLKNLSQTKFESMNHSDQHNPRRLIRAIEIDQSPIQRESSIKNLESTLIGLRCIDDSNHRYKIRERVLARLKQGAVQETKSLLKKYDHHLQSMSAIGYKNIIEFLEKKVTESEMIDSWIAGELAYTKRQMTWFRKQKIIWYDA